jgi:hypothetical protein
MKQTKNIKLDIIENFIQWAYDNDLIGEEAPDLKLEAKGYVLGDVNDEVKDGLTDLITGSKDALEEMRHIVGRINDVGLESYYVDLINSLEDAIKPFK